MIGLSFAPKAEIQLPPTDAAAMRSSPLRRRSGCLGPFPARSGPKPFPRGRRRIVSAPAAATTATDAPVGDAGADVTVVDTRRYHPSKRGTYACNPRWCGIRICHSGKRRCSNQHSSCRLHRNVRTLHLLPPPCPPARNRPAPFRPGRRRIASTPAAV